MTAWHWWKDARMLLRHLLIVAVLMVVHLVYSPIVFLALNQAKSSALAA